MKLINPTKGSIFFKNENITNFNNKQMINVRKKLQMIFQDPFASLNPRKNIFDILGISEKDSNEKFGFLMNAFKYGAPPHGGMAFGLDRIVMLLVGSNQIRDVIAFPKTTSATSLMDNSPSLVDTIQLDELGLKIKS